VDFAKQRPRIAILAPILLVAFVAVQVAVMWAFASTPECLPGFSLEETGGNAPAPVYECVPQ
jgi:hypothetical protein